MKQNPPILAVLGRLAAAVLLFSSLATTADAKAPALRKVAGPRQLAALLAAHKTQRFRFGSILRSTAGGVAAMTDTGSASSVSHSQTNVQVQGVDEADTVKVTDDGLIVQIQGNQVRIIRGYPVASLQLMNTLSFPDPNFWPTGLFVEGKHLVVLGSSWEQTSEPVATPVVMAARLAVWSGGNSLTRALVYDLTDPESPVLERQLSIEGDYLSARKIGPAVYLVARNYPRFYLLDPAMRQRPAVRRAAANLVPVVLDSAVPNDTDGVLDPTDIYYMPRFVEPDYVVVAGFSLDAPDVPADVNAYLGAGETVYASTGNLYLSASDYAFVAVGRDVQQTDATSQDASNASTRLYKFAIANGASRFVAAGRVPGTVLNQYALDENGGNLRVATTIHGWNAPDGKSRNQLYVLDGNLSTVGRLGNLAPGEQIYATRFIGDRCYMVTFRLTDPLFVIDLAAPDSPKVLGELKIPGFSTYLHPLDATHLIGFGKDATIVSTDFLGGDLATPDGMALYQGMKLSLFDVSDVAKPSELHSISFGDRGTDSPVLYDPKALFENRERQLIGFPVTVDRIPDGTAPSPWNYGEPVFQGAYVYRVSVEKGFERVAEISHVSDPAKYPYNTWAESIDRLVSIESGLYSLSQETLQVHDLDTFDKLGELTPGSPPSPAQVSP